jgi:hypothetical protein
MESSHAPLLSRSSIDGTYFRLPEITAKAELG